MKKTHYLFCVLCAIILFLFTFTSCDLVEKLGLSSIIPGTSNSEDDDSGESDTQQNPSDTSSDTDTTPKYNVTWDKTEIKIALNCGSVDGLMSSGIEKYYNGTSSSGYNTVDELVKARNLAASSAVNARVMFQHHHDTNNIYDACQEIRRLLTESSSTPDIICDYAHSMEAVALHGMFANLLTKEISYNENGENKTKAIDNHFLFSKEGYEHSDDDGYYWDYMKSFSLSDDKIYLLASEYTVDVSRGALVVPINVNLMDSITAEDSYTGDMKSTLDFYNLVWKTEDKYSFGWTYDVLAHYSAKIHEMNSRNGNSQNLSGFMVVPTQSIGAGLLYSTDVNIINKTPNNDGTYKFEHSTDNNNLKELLLKISTLFSDNLGIVTYSSREVFDLGYKNSMLDIIKDNFTQSTLLFGGITTLGSLDDTEYQSMKTKGSMNGFGFAPVPTYKSGTDYKTTVHNTARIIAVTKMSLKRDTFTVCSALLDCLSRTSKEVLNEYSVCSLGTKHGSLKDGANEKMFAFINKRIKGSVDYALDDAINDYNYQTIPCWYDMITSNKFDTVEFDQNYFGYAHTKQQSLESIINNWNTFN